MKILTYQDLKIKLLWATPEPQKVIQRACDLAIKYVGVDDAVGQAPAKLVRHLIENPHHSVLEQVHYSFLIENMSRALLAQITRQRTAHPMSGSQHYQNYSLYNCVVHPKYQNNAVMREALHDAFFAYNRLIEQGVPRSEARMVLPQAACVNFIFTIDARNLMYFLQRRLTKRNVAEMRHLNYLLRELATEHFPEMFSLVSPDKISPWEEKLNKNTEERDDV